MPDVEFTLKDGRRFIADPSELSEEQRELLRDKVASFRELEPKSGQFLTSKGYDFPPQMFKLPGAPETPKAAAPLKPAEYEEIGNRLASTGIGLASGFIGGGPIGAALGGLLGTIFPPQTTGELAGQTLINLIPGGKIAAPFLKGDPGIMRRMAPYALETWTAAVGSDALRQKIDSGQVDPEQLGKVAKGSVGIAALSGALPGIFSKTMAESPAARTIKLSREMTADPKYYPGKGGDWNPQAEQGLQVFRKQEDALTADLQKKKEDLQKIIGKKLEASQEALGTVQKTDEKYNAAITSLENEKLALQRNLKELRKAAKTASSQVDEAEFLSKKDLYREVADAIDQKTHAEIAEIEARGTPFHREAEAQVIVARNRLLELRNQLQDRINKVASDQDIIRAAAEIEKLDNIQSLNDVNQKIKQMRRAMQISRAETSRIRSMLTLEATAEKEITKLAIRDLQAKAKSLYMGDPIIREAFQDPDPIKVVQKIYSMPPESFKKVINVLPNESKWALIREMTDEFIKRSADEKGTLTHITREWQQNVGKKMSLVFDNEATKRMEALVQKIHEGSARPNLSSLSNKLTGLSTIFLLVNSPKVAVTKLGLAAGIYQGAKIRNLMTEAAKNAKLFDEVMEFLNNPRSLSSPALAQVFRNTPNLAIARSVLEAPAKIGPNLTRFLQEYGTPMSPKEVMEVMEEDRAEFQNWLNSQESGVDQPTP